MSIRFSSMHSSAPIGSDSAYRTPLCGSPWGRPEVPQPGPVTIDAGDVDTAEREVTGDASAGRTATHHQYRGT
jgi:hypothetical protein